MNKLIFLTFILITHVLLAAQSYNVANSSSLNIDEHSSCKKVQNTSGKAVFIPTKTSGEWALVTTRTGLTVSACDCETAGASPAPGTACTGGTIFVWTLSPGATSGSGTDKYMTTPSGCSDIPAASVSVVAGGDSVAFSDFTPGSCSGTDYLEKNWKSGNTYDVPGLINQYAQRGVGFGATNTDSDYGSWNTSILAAITNVTEGGYYMAVRYCDKLNYGGHADWFLPNRYELNLLFVNKAVIPGLSTTGRYWSTTEVNNFDVWTQQFDTGFQEGTGGSKWNQNLIRGFRRF